MRDAVDHADPRDDVDEIVARSIQKLPFLGAANPQAVRLIGQEIDDWMPAPDDSGLEDDAPDAADARGPIGVVARSAGADPTDVTSLVRARVNRLMTLVRTTPCKPAQRAYVQKMIDGLQVGVLGDDAASITAHYSRRIMDTLGFGAPVTDRKVRAQRAHQLSREAQRRSAMAKAYSAAARRRLARSA